MRLKLWTEGGEATVVPVCVCVCMLVWRAHHHHPDPQRTSSILPLPASLNHCIVSVGAAVGFHGQHNVRGSLTLGPFLYSTRLICLTVNRGFPSHFAKDNDEVRASGRHFAGVLTVW